MNPRTPNLEKSNLHAVSLHRTPNAAPLAVLTGPESGDGPDEDKHDEPEHHAVLDSRGACFIPPKSPQHLHGQPPNRCGPRWKLRTDPTKTQSVHIVKRTYVETDLASNRIIADFWIAVGLRLARMIHGRSRAATLRERATRA